MKSRSTLPQNTILFRHELFFTDPESDDSLVAKAYPDYDPAKPLDQFEHVYELDEEGNAKIGKNGKPISRDSFIRLRRSKVAGDGEAVYAMVRSGQEDHARKLQEAADMVAKGLITEEDVRVRDDRVSNQRAEIAQMIVDSHGPYFWLPKDFTVEDETGSGDDEEAQTPHELAGQKPPFNDPRYYKLWDDAVLDAVTIRIHTAQKRRTPEEQAEFPTELLPLADAEEVSDGGGDRGEGPPAVADDHQILSPGGTERVDKGSGRRARAKPH